MVGRVGGRCLTEGGSYFNCICFRSESLIERGIQIIEGVYTKHLGGRNGCVRGGGGGGMLGGVQTLFRGRWLDIISKVYFTLWPIDFS